MKKLIAKHAEDKKVVSDILRIGVEAREAAAKDSEVVNATVGMLYNDEGEFVSFSKVIEKFNELDAKDALPYASTPGSKKFHDTVEKWILRQYLDMYKKDFYMTTMATPGGSGALSISIFNYLEPNDRLLLPNIGWDPYWIICRERNVRAYEYNLFNDEMKFDLENLEKQMAELAKEQERIVLLINDPCQNPTGYTLALEEWENLVNLINKFAKDVPVVLIYDMAYIDYHIDGLDASRKPLEKLHNLADNTLLLCMFSGSKTLSFYGIRMGAIFAISRNEEAIQDFKNVLSFSARGTWSSSSHVGMLTFTNLMDDKEALQQFEKELHEAKELLVHRGRAFVEEAKEVGLKTYPYHSGYFITVPNCPIEVYEKLIERKIYTIPLPNDIVRFAVSSFPSSKVKGLAKAVKEIQLELGIDV